eukprot:GHRR01020591.1.p1 GENE.GHRR01020591.1~~GHRR01020591.1.p1  ORF type:complete len:190 (+),score=33.82 GHRR01020591.1:49-618(+)
MGGCLPITLFFVGIIVNIVPMVRAALHKHGCASLLILHWLPVLALEGCHPVKSALAAKCWPVTVAPSSLPAQDSDTDRLCVVFFASCTLCRDKIHLLSDYAQQRPLADSEVQRTGGLALLPRKMSSQLQQKLQQLRSVVDVPRPSLTDATADGVAAWNWTVLTVMLGAAGLVRYLIDAYPDDLPEYDPV